MHIPDVQVLASDSTGPVQALLPEILEDVQPLQGLSLDDAPRAAAESPQGGDNMSRSELRHWGQPLRKPNAGA